MIVSTIRRVSSPPSPWLETGTHIDGGLTAPIWMAELLVILNALPETIYLSSYRCFSIFVFTLDRTLVRPNNLYKRIILNSCCIRSDTPFTLTILTWCLRYSFRRSDPMQTTMIPSPWSNPYVLLNLKTLPLLCMFLIFYGLTSESAPRQGLGQCTHIQAIRMHPKNEIQMG